MLQKEYHHSYKDQMEGWHSIQQNFHLEWEWKCWWGVQACFQRKSVVNIIIIETCIESQWSNGNLWVHFTLFVIQSNLLLSSHVHRLRHWKLHLTSCWSEWNLIQTPIHVIFSFETVNNFKFLFLSSHLFYKIYSYDMIIVTWSSQESIIVWCIDFTHSRVKKSWLTAMGSREEELSSRDSDDSSDH